MDTNLPFLLSKELRYFAECFAGNTQKNNAEFAMLIAVFY